VVGHSRSTAMQASRSAPMSKAALCATSGSPPVSSSSWSSRSAKVGWLATMSGVMPCRLMLMPSKWSNPSGGRVSHEWVETTTPSRTTAAPIAQMEPRRELAVSTSMATKSRPPAAEPVASSSAGRGAGNSPVTRPRSAMRAG
jgi:hypothetical protein